MTKVHAEILRKYRELSEMKGCFIVKEIEIFSVKLNCGSNRKTVGVMMKKRHTFRSPCRLLMMDMRSFVSAGVKLVLPVVVVVSFSSAMVVIFVGEM